MHGFCLQKNHRSYTIQKTTNTSTCDEILEDEKWYNFIIQVSIPFFIAGIGSVGAGFVMGSVSQNVVFKEVKALYILVPALLGLKGNLDMCLASRLSTQANLGNMESKKELLNLVSGNIILVQIQAIVSSCVVSAFATAASAVINNHFSWLHTLFIATASMLTATLTCFVLDLMLVAIIVISSRTTLNPDNLATPLVSCIGDILTLIIFVFISELLYKLLDNYMWMIGGILLIYIFILLPIWIFIFIKNTSTSEVLTTGWIPVITASIISSSGGLILDLGVGTFTGYEVFQLTINGVGGNLVSIQACRTSTMLHKTSLLGTIPLHTKQWVTPWKALITGVLPARTARLLILLSIPGQIIFVFLADFMYYGTCNITTIFLFTYLLVGLIQVCLLLYVSHLVVHTMWKYEIDPDTSAIPYLTSLGDLSGSGLLVIGFLFLISIKSEYQPSRL